MSTGFDTFLDSIGHRAAHWLLLTEVPPQVWSFEITKQPKVMGRSKRNDILLVDPLISRLHAEIWRDDQGVVILRDLGSSNGTLVNGKRISERRMDSGDYFKIEKFVLQVVDTQQLRSQVEMFAVGSTSERLDSRLTGETIAYFLRHKCPATVEPEY